MCIKKKKDAFIYLYICVCVKIYIYIFMYISGYHGVLFVAVSIATALQLCSLPDMLSKDCWLLLAVPLVSFLLLPLIIQTNKNFWNCMENRIPWKPSTLFPRTLLWLERGTTVISNFTIVFWSERSDSKTSQKKAL